MSVIHLAKWLRTPKEHDWNNGLKDTWGMNNIDRFLQRGKSYVDTYALCSLENDLHKKGLQ